MLTAAPHGETLSGRENSEKRGLTAVVWKTEVGHTCFLV